MSQNVDPNLALAIIQCESGEDPNAVNYNKNGTVDRGLFQINSSWWQFFNQKGLDVKHDPIDNIIAGFYLLKQNGTKDWNASKACWKPKIARPDFFDTQVATSL